MSHPGDKERWDRPDASMSLLADLLSGSGLDPGYEAAAARRAASGDRTGRARRASRLLAATLLLGLLGAIAVVQVRRGAPVAERQRNALIAQIQQRTQETDTLQRQADALRGQTEALRRSALARSDAGQSARQELDRAAGAAAALPVGGTATVVTVDDARGGDQDGRIYDQDLQRLVNGLWAAGATAMAINGQRVTSTTAIRSAGNAILVDYRPLSPPYAVTALGGSGLERDFAGSAASRAFRTLKATYGIRYDISQEDSVRLPAAPALGLRYARTVTTK